MPMKTTRVAPDDDRRPTDPELQGVVPVSSTSGKKKHKLEEIIEYWELSPGLIFGIICCVGVLVGIIALASLNSNEQAEEIIENTELSDQNDVGKCNCPAGKRCQNTLGYVRCIACPQNYIPSSDGNHCILDVCAPPGRLVTQKKINNIHGDLIHTIMVGDQFGRSVAPAGDLDGNGVPDMAVGAPYDEEDGTKRGLDYGSIYILFLSPVHTVTAQTRIGTTEGGLGTVGGLAHPMDKDDYFGGSVTSLGDLDGDGVPDLIVGAFRDDDGGKNRGALYVLFMQATGNVKKQQKISSTEGGLALSLVDNSQFGKKCSVVGEVDRENDKVEVVTMGKSNLYFLELSLDGTVKSAQQLQDVLVGGSRDIAVTGGVAGMGDVDGNGVVDIAVGQPLSEKNSKSKKAGAVHVLLMQGPGSILSRQTITFSTTPPGGGGRGGGVGIPNGHYFGHSVAGLGDLDGDGTPDLAVTSVFYPSMWDGGKEESPALGAVHILLLNSDGSLKAQSAISAGTTAAAGAGEGEPGGGLIWTVAQGDKFGSAVATLAGREDGEEGVVTLAVGAFGDKEVSGKEGGAVYILTLPPGFVEVCPEEGEDCIRTGDASYTCG